MTGDPKAVSWSEAIYELKEHSMGSCNAGCLLAAAKCCGLRRLPDPDKDYGFEQSMRA